jgi:geranylgeranyl transferase type-2 subunit beta
MSGVYWGLTALHLINRTHMMDSEDIITWVLSCQKPSSTTTNGDNEEDSGTAIVSGGFGGSERHDPHLLYTLSALQILALYDRLDAVNADEIASCMFDG